MHSPFAQLQTKAHHCRNQPQCLLFSAHFRLLRLFSTIYFCFCCNTIPALFQLLCAMIPCLNMPASKPLLFWNPAQLLESIHSFYSSLILFSFSLLRLLNSFHISSSI